MADIGHFCPVQAAVAGTAGFGLGTLMGLFFYGGGPFQVSSASMGSETLPTTARAIFKDMYKVSVRQGKSFAVLGALFSGTECIIEGYRAKHDVWNVIGAGAVSGAILSAKSGLYAMAMGAAGFASFSFAIDHFFMSKGPAKDEF